MAVEAGSMRPLLDAPDTYIGGPEAKSKATQVMQLEMTGQLLEDLLKSIRSGKPPQIFFGTTPVCGPLNARRIGRNLEREMSSVGGWLHCCTVADGDGLAIEASIW
jgi:hypothetical protein